MGRPVSPPTGKWQNLAELFRRARGERPVEDIRKHLGLKKASLVYQVEQGIKRPARDKIEQWANAYGIPLTSEELWQAYLEPKLWYWLAKTVREQQGEKTEEQVSPDPFAPLSAEERAEALLYIDFLQWKRQKARSAELQRETS